MTAAAHLTWLDMVVIILFVFFIVRGVWIGLVRQIAFLASLVLGFVAAGSLHRPVYGVLRPYFDNAEATFFLVYIVLFAFVYIIISLLGKGVQHVMSISFMGWFDRLMGGIFGAAKAVIISAMLFMIAAGLTGGGSQGMQSSFVAPYLKQASSYMLGLVKNGNGHLLFFGVVPKGEKSGADPAVPEGSTETPAAPVPGGEPNRASF